jgi:hypothetical protein
MLGTAGLLGSEDQSYVLNTTVSCGTVQAVGTAAWGQIVRSCHVSLLFSWVLLSAKATDSGVLTLWQLLHCSRMQDAGHFTAVLRRSRLFQSCQPGNSATDHPPPSSTTNHMYLCSGSVRMHSTQRV